MKQREPRRPVMIRARMRAGVCWDDISILNISSKGMMLHARQAPPRGSYLEVRRGRHAIVARVVWSANDRFGIATQDRISVEALIREPTAGETADVGPDGQVAIERRTQARQRHAQRHDSSRQSGRTMEFVSIALVGAITAFAAYGMVRETLSAPMAQVAAALRPR